MKTTFLILAFALGTLLQVNAQENKSIAAGYPAVNGLYATPEIAAKLIRLELTKLGGYSVYDEYDMKDAIANDSTLKNDCISKNCLVRLGQALDVDYTISGSIDALGSKIVISLKMIEVSSQSLYKTAIREFDDQEAELQRMIGILLRDMHGQENDPLLVERLEYKNDPVTSNNVGKINNSGPRIGYGFMTGDFREFALRPEDQGGLDIIPAMSMIGYQFEGQYVGTENFSGLIEGVVNISGLEQGQFIPSISILNGFRFGRAGWELAFGPGFGIERRSYGFFDTKGLFGEANRYYSESDWYEYANETYNDPDAYPEYYSSGWFQAPRVSDVESSYDLNTRHMDKRGGVYLNTMFVFAVGRTFHAGALNIPVNMFYTSRKGGGLAGINVGFNVMKSKTPIHNKSQL